MKARVYVTLRPEVLDPQGQAVANALRALGFDEVRDVRVGKYIEIELDQDPRKAEGQVASMCERLLANPVIENYRFKVEES